MSEKDFLLESVSYYDVLEQMQDGVFIIDEDFTLRYWNAAAAKILGYTAAEVCGWSCRALGPLCKRDAAGNSFCGDGLCPMELAMRGGFSGRYPHYVFARTADGRELPLSLSVCALRDERGLAKGGLCVFRDMSEEYQQLRLAGEIQKKMVTTESFSRRGLRVETLFKPLEQTGGDFVEAFFTDSGRLIITGADATGHGISAALFSVIYKSLFHAGIGSTDSPAELLTLINREFCRTVTVEGFYLTASIAIIDPATRQGLFASAGHPTALVLRQRGDRIEAEPIRERSFMIGLVEGARYEEIPLTLGEGDSLLIVSDGLYEAEDGEGTAFGMEGVADFFSRRSPGEPGRLEELYQALRVRSPLGELADDASAILVRCLRGAGTPGS